MVVIEEYILLIMHMQAYDKGLITEQLYPPPLYKSNGSSITECENQLNMDDHFPVQANLSKQNRWTVMNIVKIYMYICFAKLRIK